MSANLNASLRRRTVHSPWGEAGNEAKRGMSHSALRGETCSSFSRWQIVSEYVVVAFGGRVTKWRGNPSSRAVGGDPQPVGIDSPLTFVPV